MEKTDNTPDQEIEQNKIPLEEQDRELIAKEKPGPEDNAFELLERDGPPVLTDIMTAIKDFYKNNFSPNKNLNKIPSKVFVKKLRLLKTEPFREFPFFYKWMDWSTMNDDIRENALCIAAIIMENDLFQKEERCFTLATREYGTCIKLCRDDPFFHQPIAAGPICTGFLVKEDVVATAGPLVTGESVKNLRIVFGYRMLDANRAETSVCTDNLYQGVQVIRGGGQGNDADWALVKLDRKVTDRLPARLSGDNVYNGQEVHTIGHPVGLPMKHISGPCILDDTEENYFTANLGLYGSGCGSPVFDAYSDEVIGIVDHVNYPGLRWTGKCWVSITNVMAGTGAEGVRCFRVQAFTDALDSL